MEPFEPLRPPWAPTYDPATDDGTTSTLTNRPTPTRTKQARAKVRARDESDIECLASAQPNLSAHDMTGPTASRSSFLSADYDGEEAHAPEADEEDPMLEVYVETLNAALSSEEGTDRRKLHSSVARSSSSLTRPDHTGSSRPRRRTPRDLFASDLVAPSPNDLGADSGPVGVRPRYAPNYVKGTSSFSGYGHGTHSRKSLYGATPLVADGDKVGKLSDTLRNVLDIAKKSEMELTRERYEKWEALQAKRKEDELEAERRILAASKVKAIRKRRVSPRVLAMPPLARADGGRRADPPGSLIRSSRPSSRKSTRGPFKTFSATAATRPRSRALLPRSGT